MPSKHLEVTRILIVLFQSQQGWRAYVFKVGLSLNPICTGVTFRSHTRGGADSAHLLEIAPGGPFRPKLVLITKFSLNFKKAHI